jgi:urease beta subunit
MAGELAHYILADTPVEINPGRPTVTLTVWNTGDRAVQVGSHFHFFESNRALRFDRAASFGRRLDIPAGTAVRFEPGDSKEVRLVAIGGTRRVFGLNGLTNGSLDSPGVRSAALTAISTLGFADTRTSVEPEN